MGRRVGGFLRCWGIMRGEGEEREVRKRFAIFVYKHPINGYVDISPYNLPFVGIEATSHSPAPPLPCSTSHRNHTPNPIQSNSSPQTLPLHPYSVAVNLFSIMSTLLSKIRRLCYFPNASYNTNILPTIITITRYSLFATL